MPATPALCVRHDPLPDASFGSHESPCVSKDQTGTDLVCPAPLAPSPASFPVLIVAATRATPRGQRAVGVWVQVIGVDSYQPGWLTAVGVTSSHYLAVVLDSLAESTALGHGRPGGHRLGRAQGLEAMSSQDRQATERDRLQCSPQWARWPPSRLNSCNGRERPQRGLPGRRSLERLRACAQHRPRSSRRAPPARPAAQGATPQRRRRREV